MAMGDLANTTAFFLIGGVLSGNEMNDDSRRMFDDVCALVEASGALGGLSVHQAAQGVMPQSAEMRALAMQIRVAMHQDEDFAQNVWLCLRQHSRLGSGMESRYWLDSIGNAATPSPDRVNGYVPPAEEPAKGDISWPMILGLAAFVFFALLCICGSIR